jgi:pimeloyl-ACP methyl ester carboxylesterase
MVKEIFSRHHLLNFAGGPVSVYESGEKSLPPVLLLHGAMYDEARLSWYHLAPYLSNSRRVLALDFPRHGSSRPWNGFMDQDCLINVLDEVIRYFNLPPLPLVGLSMGGAISIGYTLKNPEKVTGLVLMGPGGLGDKVKNQFLSWAIVKFPGALTALTRYYGKMPPEKMRKSLASLFDSRENTPGFTDLIAIIIEEARLKWKDREKSMDDWQLEGLAPFKLKINFLPELHLLACPSLWLRGKNDPLVSQKDMEEAAHLAPDGIFLQIENAGHLLPLEQPAEVNKAVMDFLLQNKL